MVFIRTCIIYFCRFLLQYQKRIDHTNRFDIFDIFISVCNNVNFYLTIMAIFDNYGHVLYEALSLCLEVQEITDSRHVHIFVCKESHQSQVYGNASLTANITN